MKKQLRIIVIFRCSAFNTSEDKAYFLNSGCYGDDLAKWIMKELNELGIHTADVPEQEDFGWFFTFTVDDKQHDFVITYRPGRNNRNGEWVCLLERKRGLIASICGGRYRGILKSALTMIHSVLSCAPEIHDIRWHFKGVFDRGNEEHGMPEP